MSADNVGKKWLQRLGIMTLKEIIQFVRDPVLMFILVFAFIPSIYIAGTSVSLQIEHTPIAFIDNDYSAASREFIHSFQEPWFKSYGVISSPHEGQQLLDAGKVLAVLDIPPQYERSLLQGHPQPVEFQLDASNPTIAQIVEQYADVVVSMYWQNYVLKTFGIVASSSNPPPGLIDVHRIWFKPNLTDSWFQSMTQLTQIISALALLLPAAVMVREKERGTIEQLTVSPLVPLQITLPKSIAMTMFILIGCGLSLFVVMDSIFHIPMKGSLALFFFVTSLYVFALTSHRTYFASLCRNLTQAGLLCVTALTIMTLLAGQFTPPEAMPKALLGIMYSLPTHYYLDIAFGILLKGAGWQILWLEILVMTGIGALIFLVAMWQFTRQMA